MSEVKTKRLHYASYNNYGRAWKQLEEIKATIMEWITSGVTKVEITISDHERMTKLSSENTSLGLQLSHLKLHGNCEFCEPVYGCCESATGCGCYGYPTDFKPTDKCLEGCSTRLRAENKVLREALKKIVGPFDTVYDMHECEFSDMVNVQQDIAIEALGKVKS